MENECISREKRKKQFSSILFLKDQFNQSQTAQIIKKLL